MKDKSLFFIDKHGNTHLYEDVLNYINNCGSIVKLSQRRTEYEVFLDIIASLVYGEGIVLLDSGFSEYEIARLGYSNDEIGCPIEVIPRNFDCIEDMIDYIVGRTGWFLTLFTSGTTGIPKKATHTLRSMLPSIQIGEKHRDDVWALAYNPTHIAGIQVFFQAFLNMNTMIDVYSQRREVVVSKLKSYGVTHLSATPTYYRLLLPIDFTVNSMKRITSGGERFDSELMSNVLNAFPDARVVNIYASTEAGTILKSQGDVFEIGDKSRLKIEGDRLLIHSSIVGMSKSMGEWYDTGDIVEVLSDNPLKFRIKYRDNELVNIGGYKVNPNEVEDHIKTFPNVLQVSVYGTANSITGNILVADVVATEAVSEKMIRGYLANRLQSYKIPRIINFVESLTMTRTGKLKKG